MYECNLDVRGYELDSFNHVNNAVYLNYYEHARWQILKEAGIIEYFNDSENFLVVIETNIKYIREIRLFDKLTIRTTVKKEEPYLIFNQEIVNSETGLTLSKGGIKTLVLDKTRTPIDIPEQLLAICNE